MPGLLDRQRTIAPPGFNRWLVPPAALCIHLCIGMAYGFSVFWLPLTRAVGVTTPVVCPDSMGLLAKLTTTTCDWDKPLLGWMYTLFFVFLGSSAAIFGSWLERAGPRKAGVAAAVCWCGGLVISAAGVFCHQLWLLWLGAGVIGGIGLGLGYISPVSTLIKWFPDRRGLATGMAIMGFGGGAMVGSPLADRLMKFFAGPDSVGVWQTFLTLAAIYFILMMIGAFAYRVPPEGWSPPGWSSQEMATAARQKSFSAAEACRTPQFWLLWLVLCLNVSAGIGVIGMASPMLQEIFGGRLLGIDASFDDLDAAQLGKVAAVGAGFTGLLSLFNILGRFFWSALSDSLGRKTTYASFFLLGMLLYAAVPAPQRRLRPNDDPAGGPARDRLCLQSARQAGGDGLDGGCWTGRCLFITAGEPGHGDDDSLCRARNRVAREPVAARGDTSGLGPLDHTKAGVGALRIKT